MGFYVQLPCALHFVTSPLSAITEPIFHMFDITSSNKLRSITKMTARPLENIFWYFVVFFAHTKWTLTYPTAKGQTMVK